MYDRNVFAVLTAVDNMDPARQAFKLPENSKWFRPASDSEAEHPTQGSGEPTPAVSEEHVPDRLVITFDEALKNPLKGLQFGTDSSTSDILLGYRGTVGISGKHYRIVVGNDLRIWLEDESRFGTAVGHSGQNEEERRTREKWILALQPGTSPLSSRTTLFAGSFMVQIWFPNHITAGEEYIQNLRTFFASQPKEEDPALHNLALNTVLTTPAPSGIQTYSETCIYYHGVVIGDGAFGEVQTALRGCDGEIVAAKILKRQGDAIEPGRLARFINEFEIMKEHPHDNIVRVFELRVKTIPTIYMEYYPDGCMANTAMTEDEYVTAFGQILDGLKHLHGRNIAHRDLKPENLLVQKTPLKVVITDFGVSKMVTDDTVLQTLCGTFKYIAPEVFPIEDQTKYDLSVDIWSLGAIALEWIYNMPEPNETPKGRWREITPAEWQYLATGWHEQLLSHLDDQDDDLVIDIVKGMMHIEPTKRSSAAICLDTGFRSGLWKRRDCDNLVVTLARERGGARTPIRRRVRTTSDTDATIGRDATIVG